MVIDPVEWLLTNYSKPKGVSWILREIVYVSRQKPRRDSLPYTTAEYCSLTSRTCLYGFAKFYYLNTYTAQCAIQNCYLCNTWNEWIQRVAPTTAAIISLRTSLPSLIWYIPISYSLLYIYHFVLFVSTRLHYIVCFLFVVTIIMLYCVFGRNNYFLHLFLFLSIILRSWWYLSRSEIPRLAFVWIAPGLAVLWHGLLYHILTLI